MPTTYAIPDGRTVMAATLYAGSSSAQSITNTVNGVSFQPDLVWGKNRSNVNSHRLTDVNRGVGLVLFSNSTNGDTTGDGQLSSFNSNGWTFTSGAGAGLNESGNNYVAWNWKAGGTPITNTAGSITSQVSANPTAGFSVVTWTGNGVNAATVGHGLGVAPSMIIVKSRSASGTNTGAWYVYHTAAGAANYGVLNTTAAFISGGQWFSTAPTSSYFYLGGTGNYVNESGSSQIAYCWAAVPGYSAFGSYTGNGSNDGPFQYLGFRPRFVLIKSAAGSTGSWWLYDSSRDTYNVEQNFLMPNNSNAETVVAGPDFLSNGFKLRTSTGDLNTNGSTFIYMAFAENPFKYANAR
ncbi:MAG: hypothetical protein EBT26_03820 [Microbacteriaceae bacterium]|nr:hypothetical protein [Microbacteriaceae bacterium]NBS61165.1 hypothetical protein [Microbacteriaceae bacterium]